jgi:hypothetical protein
MYRLHRHRLRQSVRVLRSKAGSGCCVREWGHVRLERVPQRNVLCARIHFGLLRLRRGGEMRGLREWYVVKRVWCVQHEGPSWRVMRLIHRVRWGVGLSRPLLFCHRLKQLHRVRCERRMYGLRSRILRCEWRVCANARRGECVFD